MKVETTNIDGSKSARDANAADQAGGVNLTLSFGASSSESTSLQTSDTACGSTVSAGGNVNITASGQGKDSDILIRGSDIGAGHTTRLSAEGDVHLLAAQNTASLSDSNQSESGSAGARVRPDRPPRSADIAMASKPRCSPPCPAQLPTGKSQINLKIPT